MLLAGGLVVTLFDQAQAVTMDFRSPVTSFSATQEYTLDLSIPADQRVPITDIEVIIEQRLSTNSGTGLAGKLGAPVILRVKCPMQTTAGYDCPTNNALNIIKGGATATTKITSIEFVGPFISQADADAGTNAIQSGYFGSGSITGTYTGYGYDTASSAAALGTGYGYGYQNNDVSTFTDGTGNGYGYGSENLLLRFRITLSGGNLGNGHYFMTVEADTGSATIGRLSSKFTEFDVTDAGGGGGGATTTAATTTTTAAAAGRTIALTATSITPPTGALFAWRTPATSANSGDKLSITTSGLANIVAPIILDLTQGLTNAQVTIAYYTAQGYSGVSGNAALPPGTGVAGILEITISTGGGTVGTVTIPFTVTTLPSGAQAYQGVIMRLENGAWVPHGRMQFTQQGDGTFTASGTAPCCSVFAVAFDTEAPTVALTVPTGNLTGIQTLTATAADNLQLLRVEFWVDDQKVSTDTSAPYEFALDTATLTNGAHTFKAVAYDFVENSAEDSETATTNNAGAPEGPGDGEGGRGWVLWLIVGLIVIALVVLVVTFAGRKPKAP